MKTKEKLQQYLNYCEFQKTLDSKTLKAYRIDLRQYLERIGTEEPGKQEIENYIAELHQKYKQKTVKRKIASIKAFYNYLEEEEIIEFNPFRKIKVKFKEDITLPRIIPRKEIENGGFSNTLEFADVDARQVYTRGIIGELFEKDAKTRRRISNIRHHSR